MGIIEAIEYSYDPVSSKIKIIAVIGAPITELIQLPFQPLQVHLDGLIQIQKT